MISLVPIALAYTIAHYLGFLLYATQFLIPLASNPLGHGTDYFGTAGYEPNLAPLSAQTLWYFEVGTIVAGHVIGLAIAHDIALEHYHERGKATRSQLGMLAVMIGFTVFALWLLKEASEL